MLAFHVTDADGAPAGRLTLCDLAGMESSKKSGAVESGPSSDAKRKEEAKKINQSLLALSSVVAALKSEPWITPVHALAYVLMFVGGILPACAGDLHALLQPAFWRQSFVIFAIAAEFALGLHDLMLSGCAYDSERNVRAEAAALGGTPAEEESVESFEFFVWSLSLIHI